ncbi:hypothetical protein L0E83_01765 [Marichromatium gracile]|uniref:hypothetical protein n=1 Tax=Marichromatium gracile TaxID=1048 RepID=UPI001F491B51|nr:hypothetical protein [Marichromatium gracile]MCF1182159.1 hypothetical protein [Marichromatium gracile]
MKAKSLTISLATILISSTGFALSNQLSPSEEASAFKAAGYKAKGNQWRSECGLDATGSTSYAPGKIQIARDINKDGHIDVLITEGGTFCYGNTGTGFSLVSKESNDRWKLLISSQGIPKFLDTKGAGDWPDILIGGPGFCFPVVRWDGKKYNLHHFEYEGKRCQP